MDVLRVLEFAGGMLLGALTLLAFLHKLFASRAECVLTHAQIAAELARRAESTHALRDALSPLALKVAVLENEIKHIVAVTESIAERVGANGFEPCGKRSGG